jgi:hypothetical protein
MLTFEKLQAPENFQTPSINLALKAGLKFEPWCFSGRWNLEFGAFMPLAA